MLTVGRQLRAARVMAGLNQRQLAKAAGIAANTLGAMEGRDLETFRADFATVQAVQRALERAGVQLLDQPPGVRLKPAGAA